ncbi:siderophore-iron reductase FhuF (plasmid) [Tistrella mobilis]|uniref:siderophore-iron reductase FhuF n=1 Tax=Tistrella mobilis TaxID=171437 RepID=UPI0035578413
MNTVTQLHDSFTGTFSYLSEVVGADDPAAPTPTVAALLARPDLADILTRRCGATAAPATRRAAASMWSQYYCAVAGVPVVAAAMLAGRRLPVAPDACRIACDPTGQPCGFRIAADAVLAPAPDPLAVIDALICDHLMPVFDRLAVAGRMAPRLLWCNAASILVWAARVGASIRGDDALAAAARDRILARDDIAPGLANPLKGALILRPADEVADDESPFRRKICCLRYQLEGFADCGTLCPLPDRAAPAARPGCPPAEDQT